LWNSLTTHLSAEVGISLPQLQGLVAIDKFDGAARVQDISDEMLITVGATSKLVDRLERDGHAARRSNPDDRRSSIVVLTKEGAQFLSAGVDASEKYLSEILRHSFTESRAAELASELLTLRSRISQGELS
jgi:DNA-binding MarR family transcriptional regulator